MILDGYTPIEKEFWFLDHKTNSTDVLCQLVGFIQPQIREFVNYIKNINPKFQLVCDKEYNFRIDKIGIDLDQAIVERSKIKFASACHEFYKNYNDLIIRLKEKINK